MSKAGRVIPGNFLFFQMISGANRMRFPGFSCPIFSLSGDYIFRKPVGKDINRFLDHVFDYFAGWFDLFYEP